ncbi:MAG: hypothetical protein AAFR32_03560 [Pseudomonadota bacterium]
MTIMSVSMRSVFGALVCLSVGTALAAEPSDVTIDGAYAVEQRLAGLKEIESGLVAAREDLVECMPGCLTPTEAVALAFDAGAGKQRAGRFLLDVRSGGRSLFGNLNRLFFINSKQDYAEFGTLTIAFSEDVLNDLLRRARVCGGGDIVDGAIQVNGCRRQGLADPNMFTMMQRLSGRRILVEGDVRLQWIDSGSGLRPRETNKRGEYELGYYQPWVWVESADQISFVYED